MKEINNSARILPNRQELGPQLPLSQPHVILVDPSSSCNLRCKFCPTGDPSLIENTGRYQGQLSLQKFHKIISSINNFSSPLSILRLYKEGEPLLNRHLLEFVRIAKDSNIKRIDTTTNGLLLTKELSHGLINSGIDQINISLNGLTQEDYIKYTQRKINVNRLIEEIKYLCTISGDTTIYIKCIKNHLSHDEQEKFLDLFEGLADKTFLENLQPNWPSFSFDYIQPDYNCGHYGQDLTQHEVCPFIFYMMVINSDGTVSPCVQDWNHQLVVGNIDTASIISIWNGENFNKLRRDHLTFSRSKHSNCSKCPVLLHGCLDNIDNEAKDLLKYFS